MREIDSACFADAQVINARNIHAPIRLLVGAVLGAGALSGCVKQIEVGDPVIVKRDGVSVVSDWNAPTFNKPVACEANHGQTGIVVDDATLFDGSQREPIVQVKIELPDGSECVGWVFPDVLSLAAPLSTPTR